MQHVATFRGLEGHMLHQHLGQAATPPLLTWARALRAPYGDASEALEWSNSRKNPRPTTPKLRIQPLLENLDAMGQIWAQNEDTAKMAGLKIDLFGPSTRQHVANI